MKSISMETRSTQVSMGWKIVSTLMLSVIVMVLPDFAFAGSSIGDVLCAGATFFTGRTGAGIATLAVCILGVGATLGKVSWGLAMLVGAGIGIIFGGSAIVADLNETGC